jgi:very-long-chain ceramide synthase
MPIVMYFNWEWVQWYLRTDYPNPFRPMLFISYRVPGSPDTDPRYQKGYMDLVFIGYYIIVWSFFRQFITLKFCRPFARYFGITKESKLDRFGEQGYAIAYFGFFGVWGCVSFFKPYSGESLLIAV